MKRSFADILEGLEGDRARKVARKLPSWAAAGAEVPTALSLEQCSSETAARYKACLVSRIVSTPLSGQLPLKTSGCAGPFPSDDGPLPLTMPRVARFSGAVAAIAPPETIVDITGGLGVDSWAFSQVAGRVVYFERDAELAAAAERNFARLGAADIEVRCETVTPDTGLPEADLVYADPARRSAAGRKVFLLEDCTPDILTLLPQMLRKAPAVLLKLSPMADLAMLAGRLSPFLREIHVVELDGEVKELLCLLNRHGNSHHPLRPLKGDGTQTADARVQPMPAQKELEIAVIRLDTLQPGAGDAEAFRFRPQQEREAVPAYADAVRPGDTLLVPSPALLKAGAFNLPCTQWGLLKLAVSSHFYLRSGPSEAIPFFKAYCIREVLPFGNASFRQLRQRLPRAEVTARNLPLTSEALQKKMGIAPGGDAHIFACRLADGSAVLLAC